jgi:hypothetical protein
MSFYTDIILGMVRHARGAQFYAPIWHDPMNQHGCLRAARALYFLEPSS